MCIISLPRAMHESRDWRKKQTTRTTSSFAFLENKWPIHQLLWFGRDSCDCHSYIFPFLPCCTGYTGYNQSPPKKKVVDRSSRTSLRLAKRKKKKEKYERKGEIFKLVIIYYQRIASDWGCVLICDSYAPGLGQSGIGQPSSDLDMDLMPIDENLNLDHLHSFSFDFMPSYNAIKPQ